MNYRRRLHFYNNKRLYKEQIAKLKGYYIDREGNVVSKRKTLNPHIRKKGYKFFVIKTKSFKFNVAYHRLQAYQKYGDRIYKKGIEVRHLDNNPSNNSFNNIAIGTAAQNRADTPYEIRQATAQKGGDTIRKYNHNLILTLHKIGISYNKISMLTKISKGQISWIINHSTESKKQ